MAAPKRTEKNIPLDRIFLHHENPRHEPYETQSQVINWLCANEEVLPLAKDIVQHGLSPFDRFGIIVQEPGTEGKNTNYVAVEGNRRLCALKLLTDPELAPAKLKSTFEKQSKSWTPITKIPCVIFEDHNDLDLWLDRRHHGPANGVGQKPWNADQKARHSGGGSRNRVALAFLDYAEQENLISSDDRQRRLTTVQRFLSNPAMRETLGIDTSDPDNVCRNRTEDDLKILAKRFFADLLSKEQVINSRKNRAFIESYAHELSSLSGQSHRRVDLEPIVKGKTAQTRHRRRPPTKIKGLQRIPWNQAVFLSLKSLDNRKLISLYCSLCEIPLQDNTPLLAVGAWSFFETLSASAGKNSTTNFHAYLSNKCLTNYGFQDKNEIKTLREAIERTLHYGNVTKHHNISAAFNGDQLANDMETLSRLIAVMAERAPHQDK